MLNASSSAAEQEEAEGEYKGGTGG